MTKLLETRADLINANEGKGGFVDRKTLHKKLNDTIFDDEYIDDRVQEISKFYMDDEGNLKQNLLYTIFT